MKVGMMWYLKNLDLLNNIMEAMQYYEEKYHEKPDRCHVHPNTLSVSDVAISGVMIVPDKQILEDCIWVGIASDGLD